MLRSRAFLILFPKFEYFPDNGRNATIFWDFEDTLRLVPVFNKCYDIFRENLRRGRDPFDGVDTILKGIEEIEEGVSPPGIGPELEPEPEPEGEVEVEPPSIAALKSSFVRKKSKKRKNKKLKKSRRKTNRKNKKLKTKKSRRKTKRKYKR